MLLRHTMVYSLSRGLAGFVNLAFIVLFTRLLSPAEYGVYTLAITMVGLLNSLFFHSVRMSLMRHYEEEDKRRLMSTIFTWFHTFILIIIIAAAICEAFLPFAEEHRAIWRMSLVYLWMLAWFELNLTLYRSRLEPIKYGRMFVAKYALALCIALILVLLDWGALGLMAGMAAGTAVVVFVPSIAWWRTVRFRFVHIPLLKKLLAYGMPLTVSFTMGFLIHGSGRALLGWFDSAEAAGLYAVAYDITQQSILMLMTVVNLAAFPIVLKKLEHQDEAAVQEQLKKNATLLFMISVPATAGIIVLGTHIAEVFLGSEFREAAVRVLPVVAIAAFLQGAKQYYVDLSFQLAHRTSRQMMPVVISVLVNLGLNVWWIPVWGMTGTAYAALVSHIVGLAASIHLANRTYKLPVPAKELAKIAAATGIMVAALLFVRSGSGLLALLAQILFGAAVYFAAAWTLKLGGTSLTPAKLFHRRQKGEAQ